MKTQAKTKVRPLGWIGLAVIGGFGVLLASVADWIIATPFFILAIASVMFLRQRE